MAGARLGGAELFFERLSVALRDAGDEVLTVIRRDEARAARLRAAGLPVTELAFGGPALDWRTKPRLRQALNRFAPAVAISWMSRASAHMPRGPWVSVGRLGGYYDLRHYRGCDHLIGNTRRIVAWLRQRGWPESRTHYLPNFVRDFAGAAPAPDLAGLPRPLLLGLGRLHDDKGFDTLIEAMAHLPGATLAIAGAGPRDGKLRRQAQAAGVAARVRFLGWRNDVGALLAACDVFVCSSRVEPLGNMVLEAWSARRPVVAADAAGPHELIRDGEDGLLVPINQARALAGAIQTIAEDRDVASRVAAAGRTRFEQDFADKPVLALWRAFIHAIAQD